MDGPGAVIDESVSGPTSTVFDGTVVGPRSIHFLMHKHITSTSNNGLTSNSIENTTSIHNKYYKYELCHCI